MFSSLSLYLHSHQTQQMTSPTTNSAAATDETIQNPTTTNDDDDDDDEARDCDRNRSDWSPRFRSRSSSTPPSGSAKNSAPPPHPGHHRIRRPSRDFQPQWLKSPIPPLRSPFRRLFPTTHSGPSQPRRCRELEGSNPRELWSVFRGTVDAGRGGQGGKVGGGEMGQGRR